VTKAVSPASLFARPAIWTSPACGTSIVIGSARTNTRGRWTGRMAAAACLSRSSRARAGRRTGLADGAIRGDAAPLRRVRVRSERPRRAEPVAVRERALSSRVVVRVEAVYGIARRGADTPGRLRLRLLGGAQRRAVRVPLQALIHLSARGARKLLRRRVSESFDPPAAVSGVEGVERQLPSAWLRARRTGSTWGHESRARRRGSGR
jgi:hypothetical protein